MQHRAEKLKELLMRLAAEFLVRESNGTSLVTVTGIWLSDKMTAATILLSVFPEDKQEEALAFTLRKRHEFRGYVQEHAKMRTVPTINFDIDYGEKNRQRIEEISQKG